MINCPNCNHQNPDGALQCEACYTPLPTLASCPNCGASIQADASFCGQCGSDLREETLSATSSASATGSVEPDSGAVKTQNFLDPEAGSSVSEQGSSQAMPAGLPDLISPDPLIEPEPIGRASTTGSFSSSAGTEVSIQSAPEIEAEPAKSEPIEAEPIEAEIESAEPEASSQGAFITEPEAVSATPVSEPVSSSISTPPPSAPTVAQVPPRASSATQLQVHVAKLRQVQTNTTIEIPRQLSVVRIGKPNDHTPPDIDVSGFPDSEIVSRVHANIRVEGDTYYLEDVGSSNGTYINGLPLPVGNRHRLRPGDRIALGKGDKVSFIFENS